MNQLLLMYKWIAIFILVSFVCSCSTTMKSQTDLDQDEPEDHPIYTDNPKYDSANYESRLPRYINTSGQKTVLIDPNVHAWGAYNENGELIRAGIATAGGAVCPPDAEGESDCRTGIGTFRVTSLGGEDCYSKTYPRPKGGGLMPFCMYFNNGQALHGSPDNIVTESNVSHGCVRMHIPDAEWMRYNFAQVGTKVVVVPYDE